MYYSKVAFQEEESVVVTENVQGTNQPSFACVCLRLLFAVAMIGVALAAWALVLSGLGDAIAKVHVLDADNTTTIAQQQVGIRGFSVDGHSFFYTVQQGQFFQNDNFSKERGVFLLSTSVGVALVWIMIIAATCISRLLNTFVALLCVFCAVTPLYTTRAIFESALCGPDFIEFHYTTLNADTITSFSYATNGTLVKNVDAFCTKGDGHDKVTIGCILWLACALVALTCMVVKPLPRKQHHATQAHLFTPENNRHRIRWTILFILIALAGCLSLAAEGIVQVSTSTDTTTDDMIEHNVQVCGTWTFNPPQAIPYSSAQLHALDDFFFGMAQTLGRFPCLVMMMLLLLATVMWFIPNCVALNQESLRACHKSYLWSAILAFCNAICLAGMPFGLLHSNTLCGSAYPELFFKEVYNASEHVVLLKYPFWIGTDVIVHDQVPSRCILTYNGWTLLVGSLCYACVAGLSCWMYLYPFKDEAAPQETARNDNCVMEMGMIEMRKSLDRIN